MRKTNNNTICKQPKGTSRSHHGSTFRGIRRRAIDEVASSLLALPSSLMTCDNAKGDQLQSLFHTAKQQQKKGENLNYTMVSNKKERLENLGGGVLGAIADDSNNATTKPKQKQHQRIKDHNSKSQKRTGKAALPSSPLMKTLHKSLEDAISDGDGSFLEGDVLRCLGRLSIQPTEKSEGAKEMNRENNELDEPLSVLVGGGGGKENGTATRRHRNKSVLECDDLGGVLCGGSVNQLTKQHRQPNLMSRRFGRVASKMEKSELKARGPLFTSEDDERTVKSENIVVPSVKGKIGVPESSCTAGSVNQFTPEAKTSRKRQTSKSLFSSSQKTADLTPCDEINEEGCETDANEQPTCNKSEELLQTQHIQEPDLRRTEEMSSVKMVPSPMQVVSIVDFSLTIHSPPLEQPRKRADCKPTPYRFDLGDDVQCIDDVSPPRSSPVHYSPMAITGEELDQKEQESLAQAAIHQKNDSGIGSSMQSEILSSFECNECPVSSFDCNEHTEANHGEYLETDPSLGLQTNHGVCNEYSSPASKVARQTINASSSKIGQVESKPPATLLASRGKTEKKDPTPLQTQKQNVSSPIPHLCKPDPPTPLIRLRQIQQNSMVNTPKPDPPSFTACSPEQIKDGDFEKSDKPIQIRGARDPTPCKQENVVMADPTSPQNDMMADPASPQAETYCSEFGERNDENLDPEISAAGKSEMRKDPLDCFESGECNDENLNPQSSTVSNREMRKEPSLESDELADNPYQIEPSTSERVVSRPSTPSPMEVCYFDVEVVSDQARRMKDRTSPKDLPSPVLHTTPIEPSDNKTPVNAGSELDSTEIVAFKLNPAALPEECISDSHSADADAIDEQEVKEIDIFQGNENSDGEEACDSADYAGESKEREIIELECGNRESSEKKQGAKPSRRRRKQPERFGSYATEEDIERKLRRKKKIPPRNNAISGGSREAKAPTEVLAKNTGKCNDAKGLALKQNRKNTSTQSRARSGVVEFVRSSHRKPHDSSDEGSDAEVSDWTEEEVEHLRQAHSKVDPTASFYWDRVAHFVSGRTAEECSTKWFSLVATPKIRKTNNGKQKAHGAAKYADDVFDLSPQLHSSNQYADITSDTMDLGSPIKLDLGQKQSRGNAVGKKYGYQSYIAKLKRAVKQEHKTKRKARNSKLSNQLCRGALSESVREGDYEIKASITPGGSLKVKQANSPQEFEDMDDFWDEEYE